MSDEHEELTHLITHPGWLRWKEHVRQEWGSKAYAEKLDRAAHADNAPVQIMSITFAKNAVMALLAWPEERVKVVEQARAKEAEPLSHSRRGML